MPQPPDALLLIAPGCPHCGSQLKALSEMVKSDQIGRLEVVNIAHHPEAAQTAGTRSVPWTRIGPYELDGAHTPSELVEWAERAAAGGGMSAYLGELLAQQKLERVIRQVNENPGQLPDLVNLLADLDTPMGVRIGVGAVLEDLEPGLLETIVPELGTLTRAEEPQIRADACHYLGLSRSPQAAAFIRPLLEDPDPEVREIAAESLPLIKNDTD